LVLEVRQIGIRLDVGGAGDAAAAKPKPASAADPCGAPLSPSERASIVRDCVAATLAELARRSER
jgi:hypothetical protein